MANGINGNGDRLRSFYTIIGISFMIGGIVLAIGNTRWTAEANKIELCEHKKECIPKVEKNTTDIIEIKSDIKYIVKAVERIEKKL